MVNIHEAPWHIRCFSCELSQALPGQSDCCGSKVCQIGIVVVITANSSIVPDRVRVESIVM